MSEGGTEHRSQDGQDSEVSTAQVSDPGGLSFGDGWFDTSRLCKVPRHAFDVDALAWSEDGHHSTRVLELHYSYDGTIDNARISHTVPWSQLHWNTSASANPQQGWYGAGPSRDYGNPRQG